MEIHQPEVHGKPIPVDWHIPEDLPILFVNNMTIQFTEHEFILTFYELAPPPLLGPLAEQKLEQMEKVSAVAVARIAVAAGRLPGFIKAMTHNLERNCPELVERLEDTNE
jgi:hypothetical protein